MRPPTPSRDWTSGRENQTSLKMNHEWDFSIQNLHNRLRVKSLVVNESWMGFHLLTLHTYTTSTIDFKVLVIDVWLQSLTFSCISQTIERHLSADDDEESFLRRGSRGESTLSPGPGLKPVSPGARYVSACYSFVQIFSTIMKCTIMMMMMLNPIKKKV